MMSAYIRVPGILRRKSSLPTYSSFVLHIGIDVRKVPQLQVTAVETALRMDASIHACTTLYGDPLVKFRWA